MHIYIYICYIVNKELVTAVVLRFSLTLRCLRHWAALWIARAPRRPPSLGPGWDPQMSSDVSVAEFYVVSLW